MENNKIIKSARIINTILKIIQGFMAAGVIVSAIFIPLTLVFGEKVLAKTNEVELGIFKLHLADTAYIDLTNVKLPIIMTLVLAIIMCAIGWYGIRLLRTIIIPMKDGRPFENGISKKIRKLAWVSLIGGAICEIGMMASKVFEMKIYDFSMIFNSDAVTGYSGNYVINGTFIVLAVVLFILSYIFHYGEELQKESDETL